MKNDRASFAAPSKSQPPFVSPLRATGEDLKERKCEDKKQKAKSDLSFFRPSAFILSPMPRRFAADWQMQKTPYDRVKFDDDSRLQTELRSDPRPAPRVLSTSGRRSNLRRDGRSQSDARRLPDPPTELRMRVSRSGPAGGFWDSLLAERSRVEDDSLRGRLFERVRRGPVHRSTRGRCAIHGPSGQRLDFLNGASAFEGLVGFSSSIHFRAIGRRRENTLPCPASLSTVARPP